MKQILPNFNAAARRYNSGDRPFILVDIGDDDPMRGDSHGYIGLAKRIAEKTSGEFMFVDAQTLRQMYPDEQEDDLRRIRLFRQRGCPDFYFSRACGTAAVDYIQKNGCGVHVSDINERLNPGLWTRLKYVGYPMVPHHLTREKLAYEGHRFAEEFQELPRPFIGVLMTSAHAHEVERVFSRFGETCKEAAIFLCSSSRTREYNFNEVESNLKNIFKDRSDRFPVIACNYSKDQEFYDKDATWNIYPGLLDQADHLLLLGHSDSIAAEILTTGKSFYQSGCYDNNRFPRIKALAKHEPGTPFKTIRLNSIDISDKVADRIIKTRNKAAADGLSLRAMARLAGKSQRRGYQRI